MKKKMTTAHLLALLALASAAISCTPERHASVPAAVPAEAEGAIILALREPDAFKRIQRLSHLLPILGPAAVPDIKEALKDPSVDLGGAEIALLTRAWAMHEPGRALAWASMKPPIGLRLSALLPAAELWAKKDPQAALEGLGPLMLIPGVNTKAVQIALVRGWYDSGEPGLVDFIRDMGMGFERQRGLGVYARRAIQEAGVEAVMRWAESLPDEPEKFKLNAFRQVASELTQAQPAAGVAWCEAHCEGAFGSEMRMLVGIRWAAQDPLAALEWLSSYRAGKVRDRAVRDSYRRWVQLDREAAHAWTESVGRESAEAWFGPIAEVHAHMLSYRDSQQALSWVAAIHDEERREQSYVAIARRWREKDETAAEAWLVESPLSAEARERARTEVKLNRVKMRPKRGKKVVGAE